MLKIFKQQSTHSGVIFFVILYLLAQNLGVDIAGISREVADGAAELLAALGALSALAKIALPDAPTEKPPA